MNNITQNIDPLKIDDAIQMLNENVKEDSIKPLLSILEALKNDPDNKLLLAKISDELKSIGVMRGAVLTYAPYVWTMLSEDPFEEY